MTAAAAWHLPLTDTDPLALPSPLQVSSVPWLVYPEGRASSQARSKILESSTGTCGNFPKSLKWPGFCLPSISVSHTYDMDTCSNNPNRSSSKENARSMWSDFYIFNLQKLLSPWNKDKNQCTGHINTCHLAGTPLKQYKLPWSETQKRAPAYF